VIGVHNPFSRPHRPLNCSFCCICSVCTRTVLSARSNNYLTYVLGCSGRILLLRTRILSASMRKPAQNFFYLYELVRAKKSSKKLQKVEKKAEKVASCLRRKTLGRGSRWSTSILMGDLNLTTECISKSSPRNERRGLPFTIIL
jgi:hypothetical protein